MRDRRVVAAVDEALVLSADHELNASSFTARVAASAGADLYACVAAALATMSGPRHGGECDRFEALVAEAGEPRRARAVVAARMQRGDPLHGFGHRLYPAGDPRAARLRDVARALARTAPAAARATLRTIEALVDAVARAGGEPPALDAGLVAVAVAAGAAARARPARSSRSAAPPAGSRTSSSSAPSRRCCARARATSAGE